MALPTFVVIGAAKAGTTTIYEWLRAHPHVYVPDLKETMFFAFDPANDEHRAKAGSARFPVTTLQDYEALFDGARPGEPVGEVTPGYMESPIAPARIADLLPDARLVLSLREPVARLFSYAQMTLRLGDAQSLFDESERLASAGPLLEYAPKIERFLAHFPRERMLVVKFDDLVAQPVATAHAIYRFIGADESFTPDTSVVHNPGGVPRSRTLQRLLSSGGVRWARRLSPKPLRERVRRLNQQAPPALPADLRERLAERFRPDLLKTQELLGIDLSGWLG